MNDIAIVAYIKKQTRVARIADITRHLIVTSVSLA